MNLQFWCHLDTKMTPLSHAKDEFHLYRDNSKTKQVADLIFLDTALIFMRFSGGLKTIYKNNET